MKWKVLETAELTKSRIFRMRVDKCELPDGRIMPRYYVMEFPSWVNVIPFTQEGEILLVKQYRHAVGETTLEIPGGMADPNEKDIELAARRELREETGYEPQTIELLSDHWPNPATQNNRVFNFLARNCRKVGELNLDPFEDIEVVSVKPKEFIAMLRDGRIKHSIVVAAAFSALMKTGHLQISPDAQL